MCAFRWCKQASTCAGIDALTDDGIDLIVACRGNGLTRVLDAPFVTTPARVSAVWWHFVLRFRVCVCPFRVRQVWLPLTLSWCLGLSVCVTLVLWVGRVRGRMIILVWSSRLGGGFPNTEPPEGWRPYGVISLLL